MFLRTNLRKKDGKEHRYWSIVENRRVRSGPPQQRTVLYLGELNDTQQEAWRKSLEVFDETAQASRQVSLFPEDREIPADALDGLRVKLSQMQLHRPRPFGNCWLGCRLWDELQLDEFWQARLPQGREKVRWQKVLELLVINRLVAPGSEWRVHRHWFVHSAMDQLLDADFRVAAKNRLYGCLDRLLAHRSALFAHLQERWKDLFGAKFDVLLYDLTSTYFEGAMEQAEKPAYGHSRDGRGDCKQVVIALVLTQDGFPLAYEVMSGNTADKTTLATFLRLIEERYGKADRIWIMDRGIPTEKQLQAMRQSEPRVRYLVGTPRGRLKHFEKEFLALPWTKVRDSVEVKVHAAEGELYVLARSTGRQAKERAIRRRKLARLLRTLRRLRRERKKQIPRDTLLLKLGAAKKQAGRAWRFVKLTLPPEGQPVSKDSFGFELDKTKLKAAELGDGHYLLRTNLAGDDPKLLWELYILLTEIEAAFRCLKTDLAIRPIYHQVDLRIEAHIFVAFLAFCLMVTLKKRLAAHAPGLTPRAVLETLATIVMLEVHLPLEDGRLLVLPRYTQPEPEHRLILEKLNLKLPSQPPPHIRAGDVRPPIIRAGKAKM